MAAVSKVRVGAFMVSIYQNKKGYYARWQDDGERRTLQSKSLPVLRKKLKQGMTSGPIYGKPHFPRRPRKSQSVYLIWMTGTRYYKIGVAANVSRRRDGLQSANPLPLEIVASSGFTNAREVEAAWHLRTHAYAIGGGSEWRELDPRFAAVVARMISHGISPDVDQCLNRL